MHPFPEESSRPDMRASRLPSCLRTIIALQRNLPGDEQKGKFKVQVLDEM